VKKLSRESEIYAGLLCAYPDAKCELEQADSFQLLVATILSAQCTDKRVNEVTRTLFKSFPNPASFADAPLEEIEQAIRPTGFFRNKAKNIQACCQKLEKDFSGRVPDTMEELVSLPGVGRKTANVILGNAFQKNEGVVVDTHVIRLSCRLGLSAHSSPEKIEVDLMSLFPREQWIMLSHLLIWHGRRRCQARKPDCQQCEISNLCPASAQRLEPNQSLKR